MKNNTMVSLKSFSFLVSAILVMFQPSFSSGQATVKGGYWFSDAGPAVSDIDPTYFTHLFCAFADLDTNTNKVTISSSNAPLFSTFTQTLQQKNPSVKTLLSIGGGGGPSLASAFAKMASQASTRKSFIDSSIRVARSNNFHGLDLDWEYPSSDTDKTNFGLLLKEWSEAVAEESNNTGNTTLLLSAAVAGSDQISPLEYYPVEEIANYLDWANVMVYDLFTPNGYPTLTQPPAPLENPQGQFSGDQGITKWIQLGLPANHIALGLPFYGYSWRLVNGNEHGLFAPANGATSGDGDIGYGDIKKFISNEMAQTVYNSTFVTDYCYSGTTWIGYDDTSSVTAKVNYAKGKGLIGYFTWHIGADDDSWTLSKTASNAWGS
ncbi:class V chitinase-like [Abrus precatorius]|uniref:Class V chitinase-like n=1 Tax=Abrus precatorius TaxID=3816 RepID=A0A8B8JMZ1_ABRPR|nr:class V chitinase-like [Abrus precatorius]